MMLNNSKIDMNKLQFVIGNEKILWQIQDVKCRPIFHEMIIDFFDMLSKKLMHIKDIKNYNDILSYAFWIRRASLEQEKIKHMSDTRMGRGVAFHIAPSNVPINFAVSMTSALLAGNACIIRVSNKKFVQVDIVCDIIQELLNTEFETLKPYIVIVRYDHNDEITQFLSDMCDVRIIWGGNETIRRIRKAKLQPRAIEMAFADRYSIAIIESDRYLEQDSKKIAMDFYTDTYYSDQNACSSPRIIIWLGQNKAAARERFWRELAILAHENYQLHPIQAVDKLESLCVLAAQNPEWQLEAVKDEMTDNFLYRVQIEKLNKDIMNYKEAGGYFFEYCADNLNDILPILGKSCQTVAVVGIDRKIIKELVINAGVRGVDRIVPIGKTMELTFQWDGYDMIETMSRIVSV